MKPNYPLWSAICLLLAVPLALYLSHRRSAATAVPVVRFGTFNVSLFRSAPGQLLAELRGGGDPTARRLAEIVQRAAVDVLLLCEFDHDERGEALAVFADEYLAVSQNGQAPIEFGYRFAAPVNTGVPSDFDLDGDGAVGGPGDAFGYGAFPGQYGMAVLSRHPILEDGVRTFRTLPWSAMPGALRPDGWSDATWQAMRLSSKSHWDVPIGVGRAGVGRVVHLCCSHPTPPVFDGPEDRNGRRNHDEIRFWTDYLTPERSQWIVDDAGTGGGLAPDAPFVVLGDLNCDPVDGDGRSEAIAALLAHGRVQDPAPRSVGGTEQSQRQWGANAAHRGDAGLDTGDFDDTAGSGPGNLRLDYVLPARDLRVVGSGVFWPASHDPAARLTAASDHRLVWVDVEAR